MSPAATFRYGCYFFSFHCGTLLRSGTIVTPLPGRPFTLFFASYVLVFPAVQPSRRLAPRHSHSCGLRWRMRCKFSPLFFSHSSRTSPSPIFEMQARSWHRWYIVCPGIFPPLESNRKQQRRFDLQRLSADIGTPIHVVIRGRSPITYHGHSSSLLSYKRKVFATFPSLRDSFIWRARRQNDPFSPAALGSSCPRANPRFFRLEYRSPRVRFDI